MNLAPVLDRLTDLTPERVARLSDDDLVALTAQLVQLQAHERQTNQLRYYQPVSAKARAIHTSTCRTIGVGGGNGSSKTDSCLVELVIRCTGQIPLSLQDMYPREKLRGPINARIVVESLTTTLFPIILPKLDCRRWSGVDQAGGPRGHWGWIPKDCLIQGEWDKSWKAHERILRLYYRHPERRQDILGESTIQFMSYDQDSSDFASGDFHIVLHDEPPKEAIWVENMARTMRVDGTMLLAMTWPDDPTIAVDWMLDRLYYPAQPGPQHDPQIAWINLDTTENKNLNQTAVARVAGQMSAAERSSRIFGQPITLSNRVHPLFTDEGRTWCFACADLAIPDDAGNCGRCGGKELIRFTHVEPLQAQPTYPVIQVLDPHPRKPHMLLWVQITPNDDLEQIAELEVNETPTVVWQQVQDLEADYGWNTVSRLMDPNMGRSPSGTNRDITWQDAFDAVGMRIDLADDGEVGRRVFNEYLQPDPVTKQPRYRVDPRCVQTIYQLKRYAWDDFKRSADKGQKQRTKAKHDDFPTMLKYLVNAAPSFRGMQQRGATYVPTGRRHHGY